MTTVIMELHKGGVVLIDTKHSEMPSGSERQYFVNEEMWKILVTEIASNTCCDWIHFGTLFRINVIKTH